MALNVALPLSGLLPESMCDRYALLSPIPKDFEENLELLVTPYESSESGIGSSNDNKDPKSSSEDDEPSSTTSSVSSTSSPPLSPAPETKSKAIFDSKIKYGGRDVLDLAKNITDQTWKFQYARLPNSNVNMYMANRSQYHRLGANGLKCEYDMASCKKCTFQYPVHNPNIIFNHDGATRPALARAQDNLPSFKMYKHF